MAGRSLGGVSPVLLRGRRRTRGGPCRDGADVAYIPYVNAHFPGTRYTLRLTAERRLQRGRNATLLELGTLF
ncbi:MAG: hypothetical protein ACT4PJ_14450 [Gemmatimonadaceae bacterium]